MKKFAGFLVLIILITGCMCRQEKETILTIEENSFGEADGNAVKVYSLSDGKDLSVRIMNYGAIVLSIEVPDRTGKIRDIALGFDSLEGYLGEHPYFGAIVGRYGNRIDKGQFTLDGKRYQLAVNNGENHLHGGLKGFDKVVWDSEIRQDETGPYLSLHYLSKDGEEGYPGNLDVTVTYRLTDDGGLRIDYLAETDKTTVVNLTNHTYFNMDGEGSGNILGQEMMINADYFIPVDAGLIPTGELRPVKGTPMDFTELTAIGARIDNEDEQLSRGPGYDHCWVLNKSDDSLTLAARGYSPVFGRVMDVYTTEPGIQFYSGNFLDGSFPVKGEKRYHFRWGFCLETQHFPDSPNKPEFPSVVLKPGEKYRSTTLYRFYTK